MHSRLHRIACPTLVVAGAVDTRCPSAFAQMIADAIRPDLAKFKTTQVPA
jgi:pimeloyl-ACP methyl ester carboxylesterase